jgi:hypothetical protein
MMLTACGVSSDRGSPRLQVQVPNNCRELTKKVPLPAINVGDDARSVLARYKAALIKANIKLDGADACFATIIQRFGAGA